MSGPDLGQRIGEHPREHVVLRLVGHDPLDPHPKIGQMDSGPQHEARAGIASFVGVDLDERVTGVIVDRDVQVVIACTATFPRLGLAALPELPPPSTGADAPELLHVDVQELPWMLTLVPDRDTRRTVQMRKP